MASSACFIAELSCAWAWVSEQRETTGARGERGREGDAATASTLPCCSRDSSSARCFQPSHSAYARESEASRAAVRWEPRHCGGTTCTQASGLPHAHTRIARLPHLKARLGLCARLGRSARGLPLDPRHELLRLQDAVHRYAERRRHPAVRSVTHG